VLLWLAVLHLRYFQQSLAAGLLRLLLLQLLRRLDCCGSQLQRGLCLRCSRQCW
jgi:hypothetical protein